jgi:hypothetical protein
MINQRFTGTPTSRRQVVLPNVATFAASGVPILIGTEPGVTLDSYQSNLSGCTVLLNGTFNLTVIGRSANSPAVTAAVNPGDPLYASGGTYDATTNITYGFSLDKNISGVPFGRLDPNETKILAGVTNTAAGVQI